MLLHKGIVKVGTKLIIHNAELIGAGEGIDPLNVRIFNLKIRKLFYYVIQSLILLHLKFYYCSYA